MNYLFTFEYGFVHNFIGLLEIVHYSRIILDIGLYVQVELER